MQVTVRDCACCGGEHAGLKFRKLKRPKKEWEYWAPCPDNGDPILLAVVPDDKKNVGDPDG